METPVTNGGIIKVAVDTSAGTQGASNIWYYAISALSGIVTDKNIADALDEILGDYIKAALSSAANYVRTRVQIIDDPLPMEVYANVNAGAGGGGSTLIPRQASIVTTWLTRFAGRAYRGRTFWPFAGTTWMDANGSPTTAYRDLVTTLMGTAVGPHTISPTGGNACVLTRVLVHVNEAISPTPVIDFRVNDKYGNQRRRGDYGRPGPS